MTEQSSHKADPSTIDTGEPIAALGALEEEASATFGERLGRRIQRRRLGADVASLSWDGPIAVVVELLNILFGLIGVKTTDGNKER